MTKKTPSGKPFTKGQSGNPSGRPIGARNKATLLVEQLLDGEAEKLGRKVAEMALAGDPTAMRLCMERLCPPRKDRPISFELPTLTSAADAVGASAALMKAVAAGDVTLGEALDFSRLIDAYARALEVTEFEQRLLALEQKSGATANPVAH
jgi:hypothetical protein